MDQLSLEEIPENRFRARRRFSLDRGFLFRFTFLQQNIVDNVGFVDIINIELKNCGDLIAVNEKYTLIERIEYKVEEESL